MKSFTTPAQSGIFGNKGERDVNRAGASRNGLNDLDRHIAELGEAILGLRKGSNKRRGLEVRKKFLEKERQKLAAESAKEN